MTKLRRALFLVARWFGQAFGIWLSTLHEPLAAEIFALRSRDAKHRRESELLRARLLRLPPHQRPHYTASERIEILWHQHRYGLSNGETARLFVISKATLAKWLAEVRQGLVHLVSTREPLNKLPDLVREIVCRLKREQFRPQWKQA